MIYHFFSLTHSGLPDITGLPHRDQTPQAVNTLRSIAMFAVHLRSSLLGSWLTLLLVIAATPNLAMAQAGSTGAISGIVTDSQSAVVAGAEVQAKQLATDVITRTTT